MKFRDLITGKIFRKNHSAKDLVKHPKRNHEFSKEFIKTTKYLHKTFNEVSPSTLKKWLDDFDRDANPEKELAIWLHIAKVYEKLIKVFPKNKRTGIFQLLLQISSGMTYQNLVEDGLISQINISEKDIKAIYKIYGL
ncbi:hypothetical protein ACFLZZ_04275 [Nanoarchaeota archaeon]